MSTTRVPDRVQHAARAASRTVGRWTADRRMLPTFLISGAQRCGTTTMYKTLTTHPQVLPAVLHKGVDYFDTSYPRGLGWYRGHFPTGRAAARVATTAGGRGITRGGRPGFHFPPPAPPPV